MSPASNSLILVVIISAILSLAILCVGIGVKLYAHFNKTSDKKTLRLKMILLSTVSIMALITFSMMGVSSYKNYVKVQKPITQPQGPSQSTDPVTTTATLLLIFVLIMAAGASGDTSDRI